MKKCNNCGTLLDDNAVACESCGSGDFSAINLSNEQAQGGENVYAVKPAEAIDINDNGHIFTGIIGAFLFSIIGGIVYFIVYQLGVIAGICGFIMFVLASLGYRLFAGTKNKLSVAGLVSAIVCTVIMILLAEYACIAFEVYSVYQSEGITVLDAIFGVPSCLTEEGVRAVLSDLAFSYIFAVLATGKSVANIVKARKSIK